VYEMIVGEIPGRWPTEEATRVGRFLDAPSSHRAYLSAGGATVEGALIRALAVRADQRTPTPAQFCEELRGHEGRRKYRPDEIEAIVNRAAELEGAHPTLSGSLTMGGVEQIARDVGINAKFVRSAAAQLTPRGSRNTSMEAPKRNIIIGGPTRLLYQRTIEGELSEGDFPILVDDIRTVMGEVGQVSQLAQSFTWTLNKGSSGTRNMEVAVTVRNGRTRITIQENLGNMIGAIFGGFGGGLGGGGMGPIFAVLASMHIPMVAAVIVPAWLATVYASARTSYHYAVLRRQRRIETLIERLAETARELVQPPQRMLPR
jgi:hypothetical protein